MLDGHRPRAIRPRQNAGVPPKGRDSRFLSEAEGSRLRQIGSNEARAVVTRGEPSDRSLVLSRRAPRRRGRQSRGGGCRRPRRADRPVLRVELPCHAEPRALLVRREIEILARPPISARGQKQPINGLDEYRAFATSSVHTLQVLPRLGFALLLGAARALFAATRLAAACAARAQITSSSGSSNSRSGARQKERFMVPPCFS